LGNNLTAQPALAASFMDRTESRERLSITTRILSASASSCSRVKASAICSKRVQALLAKAQSVAGRPRPADRDRERRTTPQRSRSCNRRSVVLSLSPDLLARSLTR
jgi:hypothetical protein